MAAFATALLSAAGIFVACGPIPIGSGPLDVGEDQGSSESGGSWDPGTVISFGAPKIRNPTDAPVVIKAITLKPNSKSPGVTVTAVYVVDMSGVSETSGLAIGFPPANQAHHTFVPAVGATLKPNSWYQILFVVRIDKPGEWAFPSFDLEYETDGRRYRATVHDGLRLCAPKGIACGRKTPS